MCDFVYHFGGSTTIRRGRPIGFVGLDSAECTRENNESKEENPSKEFREAGVYYQGPPALELLLAFSLAGARISRLPCCRHGLWFPDFFGIRTLI